MYGHDHHTFNFQVDKKNLLSLKWHDINSFENDTRLKRRKKDADLCIVYILTIYSNDENLNKKLTLQRMKKT